MAGLGSLQRSRHFNDGVTLVEDSHDYDEVPIPEYEKGEEPTKTFTGKRLPFRVDNSNTNNNTMNTTTTTTDSTNNNSDNNNNTQQKQKASLTFDATDGSIVSDGDGDLNHIKVTFPKYPCNESACDAYVKNMGGCKNICKEMFGDDSYDSEMQFGVRRRSFHSFLVRYSSLVKNYLTPAGTPHKFMNCGCDCWWYYGSNVRRSYLAQYECWTCFGDEGKHMTHKQNDEMEEIGMTDFINLNQRRGVTAHFLGPKVYEFNAMGVNRPI